MRVPAHRVAAALLAALLSVASLPASIASACGGLFCSSSSPVNQAAERILFVDHEDGTVSAVVQIMYQGPSEEFAWVLPIPSVPGEDDVGVASEQAFDRLQAATNPDYRLTTRTEGECAETRGGVSAGVPGGTGGTGGTGGSGGAGAPNGGPVTVEREGTVGPFDWTVISLDSMTPEPATVAIEWLEENDYDVTSIAPELLGPYLEDGMYLIAFRLTKQSDEGSIRPVVLSYEGDCPMIPIKLTAVAANDDMGVMTWVAGPERAIPENYRHLELNEARINWFNPNSNYNDVVIAAAEEAEGQGFVTEMAAPMDQVGEVVWTSADEEQWRSVRNGNYGSFEQLFEALRRRYGAWNGFWDAVRETVTLPEDVPFEDFRACPSCYTDRIEYSPSALFDAVEAEVLDPMRDVQELLGGQEYLTRLYTTMSAEDMTLDPTFEFNPNLGDVDNVHTATRVIECNPDVTRSEAPWRIELPQGDVIRGEGRPSGSAWPQAARDTPANREIRQMTTSDSELITDNAAVISEALDAYNETVDGGGGCSMTRTRSVGLGWLLAALGVLLIRRRRGAGRKPS